MGLMDSVSGAIPEFGITKATIGKFFTGAGIFMIFVIIAIIIGVCIFFYLKNKKFNKTITLFDKINGQFMRIGSDKAREIKFGEITGTVSQDTVLLTKKSKIYLPYPKLQAGPNEYWYYKSLDQEWINFNLGDLDEDRKKLGGFIHDTDMRYARSALQKNMRDRLYKITFWDKYGGFIVWTVFCVLMATLFFLIFGKAMTVVDAGARCVNAATEAINAANKLLATADAVTGTGGLIPATIP